MKKKLLKEFHLSNFNTKNTDDYDDEDYDEDYEKDEIIAKNAIEKMGYKDRLIKFRYAISLTLITPFSTSDQFKRYLSSYKCKKSHISKYLTNNYFNKLLNYHPSIKNKPIYLNGLLLLLSKLIAISNAPENMDNFNIEFNNTQLNSMCHFGKNRNFYFLSKLNFESYGDYYKTDFIISTSDESRFYSLFYAISKYNTDQPFDNYALSHNKFKDNNNPKFIKFISNFKDNADFKNKFNSANCKKIFNDCKTELNEFFKNEKIKIQIEDYELNVYNFKDRLTLKNGKTVDTKTVLNKDGKFINQKTNKKD